MRVVSPPWPLKAGLPQAAAMRAALPAAVPAQVEDAVRPAPEPPPRGAPANPPQGLGSGLVVGLMAVVSAVSFAALIYAGPLAPYIGHGLAFALLATAVNILVVAGLASLPGTVGGSQSLPVAILAAATAGIVNDVAAPAAQLATTLAATTLSAVAAGAALLLMGHCRAGRLVRLLPYPVVGGVVAATGWLLGQGALNMAVGPAPAWHAAPAVAWALVMLLVCRQRAEPLRLLGMMLLGIVLFYACARLLGVSPAELARQGWLLQPPQGMPDGLRAGWPALRDIDWAALGGAAGSLATLPLVTAIALMLNVAGLEATAHRRLDADRELRAAGLANIASGLGGGFVGYQQLGLSAMNLRDGAATRWVGLWAAAVCLAALAFGTELLAWLPRPVLGALLLLLALLVVRPWLMASRGRLSRLDQGIVCAIVAATAVLGFLSAVLLGLVAAVLLFAVQYGRVDPVRQVLSGADYGSRRQRSPAERQRLQTLGDAVCVLQLQGYLFFGMADRLQAVVQQRLDDPARVALRFVVLDGRRLSGCDSSAVEGLVRLQQLLQARGAMLLLCQAPPDVARRLPAAVAGPRFEDLDHGLEWCETVLLQPGGDAPPAAPQPALRTQLSSALGGAALADALLARLQRTELRAGEVLIAQGARSGDLYLLESGSLSARRCRPGAPPLRLQSVSGAGEVFGEIGFFLGEVRTAEVVADEPSVVHRLCAAQLHGLQQHDPALAAALLRLLGERLSARVAHLVSVVDALEDR